MSRTSRIPHPPGSRYVPIYTWAVARFGFAGAAIVGLLEFLDRAEDMPGQPLASRARIIADLEGVVGRNSVDTALEDLALRGAIARHIEIRPGKNNITRLVRYGLDLAGIVCIIGGSKIGSSGKSLNREFRELPESGPKPGPKPVVAYKEEIEEEIEAAAPRAQARGPAGAAAISRVEEKRRHPHRSPSGIECWYLVEDEAAVAIEDSAPPEQIIKAVAAVKARNNSAGKPQSPVPALVSAELERTHREREAAERRAATAQRVAVVDALAIDPLAAARGEQILADIRRKSKTQSEVTTHD